MNENTRSRAAALLLVLGPLAFTLGDLVRRLVVPPGNPSAPAITQAVSDHHATWLAAGSLSLVGVMLLAPAVLVLMPISRGRGARTTAVGAVMVAIGSVAGAAHAVAFYSPYALYGDAGTPTPDIIALDGASESYPLLVAVIALFIVGMMLGSVVLLIGLRRARVVPIWSVLAAVVFVACGSSDGAVPGLIGVAAAVATFGPAAWSLLTVTTPIKAEPVSRAPLAG